MMRDDIERTAGGIKYELRYKRIKNINMRIVGGAVKVSAPYGTDVGYIDRFVTSHRNAIERAIQKDDMCITVPEPEAARAEVYKRLYASLVRVYPRFERYGFPLPQLKVRSMTSQWGNCRKARSLITLNSYLYSLPERCIDLVAAHELSHMVEANHSAAFYAVLASVMPDWREREKELKQYKIRKN